MKVYFGQRSKRDGYNSDSGKGGTCLDEFTYLQIVTIICITNSSLHLGNFSSVKRCRSTGVHPVPFYRPIFVSVSEKIFK